MTKGKNYNSIVFLTTLSVYLGLVLVGATPQVLAQAALTRNFDIQTEIEFEDDLDKNPDDCQNLRNKAVEKLQKAGLDDRTILNYANVLENLVKISGRFYSQNFAFQSQSDFYSNNPEALYFSLNSKPILFPKDARPQFNKELEILAVLFPNAQVESEKGFEFDFNLDDSKLETKAKFLQKDETTAHRLFVAYDTNLDFWRCESRHKPENVVLQNTEISHANNQIFIVTRLPRGSIDSLLAKRAN